MTTATGEKRGQTGVQDDYGQALAEGEITRILKTVQAAQFRRFAVQSVRGSDGSPIGRAIGRPIGWSIVRP